MREMSAFRFPPPPLPLGLRVQVCRVEVENEGRPETSPLGFLGDGHGCLDVEDAIFVVRMKTRQEKILHENWPALRCCVERKEKEMSS